MHLNLTRIVEIPFFLIWQKSTRKYIHTKYIHTKTENISFSTSNTLRPGKRTYQMIIAKTVA